MPCQPQKRLRRCGPCQPLPTDDHVSYCWFHRMAHFFLKEERQTPHSKQKLQIDFVTDVEYFFFFLSNFSWVEKLHFTATTANSKWSNIKHFFSTNYPSLNYAITARTFIFAISVLPRCSHGRTVQPGCRRHGLVHFWGSGWAHTVWWRIFWNGNTHIQKLTGFWSSLSPDDIPIKLRCAICSKLAVNAFRLPCCEQAICETC